MSTRVCAGVGSAVGDINGSHENMSHATHNRTPIHFLSECRRCVRIPLASWQGYAELDLADYEMLAASGISQKWVLNSSGNGYSYVKACTRDNVRVVARLITKASHGEQVSYLDGNPLNLRRSNLMLMRGGRATVDCSTLLAEVEEAQA